MSLCSAKKAKESDIEKEVMIWWVSFLGWLGGLRVGGVGLGSVKCKVISAKLWNHLRRWCFNRHLRYPGAPGLRFAPYAFGGADMVG